MNDPEYILSDVVKDVVAATKFALNLPVLRFEFGTPKELNVKMKDWNDSKADRGTVYPLIWMQEPYDIVRNSSVPQGFWGRTAGLNIYIMMSSDKNKYAEQRMEDVFKATIYPIYRMFLKKLDESVALSTGDMSRIFHVFTNRYLLSALDDDVDCSVMRDIELLIYNNSNCLPFTNL